jgi:hypothetical protein
VRPITRVAGLAFFCAAALVAATACGRGGDGAADAPAARAEREASALERIETALVELGRVEGRLSASGSNVSAARRRSGPRSPDASSK